jgi:hypothetical protein
VVLSLAVRTSGSPTVDLLALRSAGLVRPRALAGRCGRSTTIVIRCRRASGRCEAYRRNSPRRRPSHHPPGRRRPGNGTRGERHALVGRGVREHARG